MKDDKGKVAELSIFGFKLFVNWQFSTLFHDVKLCAGILMNLPLLFLFPLNFSPPPICNYFNALPILNFYFTQPYSGTSNCLDKQNLEPIRVFKENLGTLMGSAR